MHSTEYVTYIHIPKTAGTALFNTSKVSALPINVTTGHLVTLFNVTAPCMFVYRDPWQRFCSGFWERRTYPQRKQLNAHTMEMFKTNFHQVWTPLEKHIFSICKTPADFIDYLMQTGDYRALLEYKLDNVQNSLGMLTESITYWLGTLEQYKQLEHKVKYAVNIESLSEFVCTKYNVTLVSDPFLARRRTQFNFEQSYTCDYTQLRWFKDWRNEDYRLYEYFSQ